MCLVFPNKYRNWASSNNVRLVGDGTHQSSSVDLKSEGMMAESIVGSLC